MTKRQAQNVLRALVGKNPQVGWIYNDSPLDYPWRDSAWRVALEFIPYNMVEPQCLLLEEGSATLVEGTFDEYRNQEHGDICLMANWSTDSPASEDRRDREEFEEERRLMREADAEE